MFAWCCVNSIVINDNHDTKLKINLDRQPKILFIFLCIVTHGENSRFLLKKECKNNDTDRKYVNTGF